MKRTLAFLLIAMLSVSCSYSQNNTEPLTVNEIRIEYLENPESLDLLHPPFIWILSWEGRNRFQFADQILVASSKDKLLLEQGDHWDSGKVDTNATDQVENKGSPFGTEREIK